MMKQYCMLLLLVLGAQQAPASPPDEGIQESVKDKIGRFLKKGAKAGTKYIPYGEQVDRIEKRQKTSLDQIRDIAKKGLETKSKLEEMYYFKERSQRRAAALSEGLSRGKKRKFLGVMLEDALGISINPADYVPYTRYTKKLKKNLELDLSLESGVVAEGDYLLRDTRSSLLSSVLKKPEKFTEDYEQALAYEEEVAKALAAKERATLKYYKEEIARLTKEIGLLEKEQKKKGLTVSDVMQIELAIEKKRQVIRELNEKITAGLKSGLELTPQQQAKLAYHKGQQDEASLHKYLMEDRRKMQAKYGHLWSF